MSSLRFVRISLGGGEVVKEEWDFRGGKSYRIRYTLGSESSHSNLSNATYLFWYSVALLTWGCCNLTYLVFLQHFISEFD